MTEVDALKQLNDVLVALDDAEARKRILRWAIERFAAGELGGAVENRLKTSGQGAMSADSSVGPRARAWLARNGLSVQQLDSVLADYGSGYELILRDLPGRTSRDKAANAYLLTGTLHIVQNDTSDFGDEEARALCRRFGVYDSSNHSKALRTLRPHLTGNASSGYRLTAAGENMAANIIASMSNGA